MFATPAFPPRNVLNPSEYRYGPHRFRLSRMDVLSKKSSDFADENTLKASPTQSSTPSVKQSPCSPKPPHDPTSYMTAGLKKHFEDAQFSDLIVRCKEDEYHVHRVIMCSHSQWFAKVCTKTPRDTGQRIDLSADDPDAVDAMLQYCYQLDYADKFLGLSSAGYTIYTLRPHIDVYHLAQRYNIPGLKQLAVEKFQARAAVLCRVEANKEKFFHAIRIIYATTRHSDDELRKAAVKMCADHSEQYILESSKTATRVFKLMDEMPAFRVDFIKELALRLK